MASGQLEGDAFVTASKEYAELEPVAVAAKTVRRLRKEIETLQHMVKDSSDAELHDMAVEELEDVTQQLFEAETALAISLLPQRRRRCNALRCSKSAPGTGGDEAALFAGDLYRMYERYAAEQGWKVEPVSLNVSDIGGFKEIVATIKGNGVFAKLKFESGVHRVQRVPVTESGGRIHTPPRPWRSCPNPTRSTCRSRTSDLKIDVYRASGAGGQHVNTTDSAVRITHLPTGTVVTCQDGRSQHKNKEKAMQVLRARLYEAQRDAAQGAEAEARKAMVGSRRPLRTHPHL